MKKSFINCSNSNVEILDDLVRLLHSFKSVNLEQTFIEPFLGSGVVFLNMEKYDNFIINDANIDIFILFNHLKDNGKQLLEDIKVLNAQNNNLEAILHRYYQTSNYYERCKLFVFLNNYGISYEMLEKTENNIVDQYKIINDFEKNGVNFSEEEINYFIKKLDNHYTSIFNYSFERIFENLEYGDVVYCDPPEINKDFSVEKHVLLNKLASSASLKGSKIIISNKYNEMNKELYKDCSEYYIKKVKNFKHNKEEMIAIYA